MTILEVIADLGDALDYLDSWHRLVETLEEHADEFGVDANPVGRAVCILDVHAKSLMRQQSAKAIR